MPLDGSNDITLDSTHSHTKSQQLQCEGLTCTGCSAHSKIRILVDLRIEKVNNTKRVVMAVNTQQHAGVIRHFKAGEHIRGCGAAGQHIALGLFQKLGADLKKRHHAAQCLFLLESAFTQVHIHGLEHVDHLLLTPQKLLVGFSRDGHEYRHIEQIFIVVGNAVLDIVSGLNGVGQFLIIGTGVVHTLQLRSVQTDTLRHFIDGLTPILSGQVDINIDAFTRIDEA